MPHHASLGSAAALLRSLAEVAPISVGGVGRRRDWTLAVFDPLTRARTGMTEIATPYGPMTIDLQHDQQRLLAYCFANVVRHYRCSDLGRYIAHTARRDDTFIDVGANLGMYALLARNAGMQTVLVEPEPAHAHFLARNAAIFGRVLQEAFADGPGSAPLYYDPTNAGATSLKEAPGRIRSQEHVSITTFSQAASDGRLGDPARIGLVKIDVEGFESQAVQGMREFLAQGYRPDIWCEVRGDAARRSSGSFRPVRQFLQRHGYGACLWRRGEPRMPPDPVLARLGVFDLLFITRPLDTVRFERRSP